jgi:mersacidin/lichenicidin family type 2 lantibiotic
VTKLKEILMSYENVIRAWKDLEYRLSLSEAERAQLPEHPAGLAELTEKELEPLVGGTGIYCLATAPAVCFIFTVDHAYCF